MITALIPAYNEAESIGEVIGETKAFVDEVIVVDDGSEDDTSDISQRAGATVITKEHQGYIKALKRGFQAARGEIIVTLDADGEHNPADIPKVVAPLVKGEADLVLGSREYIPSVSERLLGTMVRMRIDVKDHGTGFRALTKELAQTLSLRGKCTCGVLVLEAASRGAKIAEVPIIMREISKERKKKWIHLFQVGYILLQIIKS